MKQNQKTPPNLSKGKKLNMLLLISFLILFSNSIYGQGTWHPLSTLSPYSSGGVMLLLSDGTVMAKTNGGGGNGNIWVKLTPDIHGSYVNGTWSTLAPMANDRLYFSSEILKDGRVYVAGGEYGSGRDNSELYDPVTNTWTALPLTGRTYSDANSEILPDGKVLQALVDGNLTGTVIYDPVTNTYANGPSSFGMTNESSWVKLKDNSILMVDRDTRNSERYIPSLNQWVADATLPVDLYDIYGSETGSAFLLPDGRAFFIGSPGTSAYYTPSGNNNPGTWTAGPSLPNSFGAPDAAGAMMVNGKILCVLSPQPSSGNVFPNPSYFYEFNYLTNTFTQINSPTGVTSENYPSFVSNMLCLPDGSILYSNQGNSQYYVYTPDGTPLAAGKPTISQITANDCNGSSYTITGTLFNGISEGAGYGDDWQMATNYPIIRLTNGSNVYYARTYNWNSTGVQTGNAVSSTQFKLPAGLPNATYSLVVTANGISSDPVTFTPAGCFSVSITSPTNNATFTAPATITINASATITNGTISKVDFYNGSTLLGTSTTAPYSYVWNNVPVGNYTLTAKATDNQNNVVTSQPVNIIVSTTVPVNLALNKYVLSSSNLTNSTLASNAVDGNMSTTWSSAYFNPQWIYVDLGSLYTINRIKINWASDYATNYKIQTSNDAVTWTDFLTVTSNSTLTNDWTGFTTSTRYVRIYCTSGATSNGYSMYELEVYGTDQPPVATITSPANNSTFPSTSNITFTSTASDPDGTISKVEFYNGTTLIGTATNAPYTITWNNVSAGTYSITAKATDNLGSTGISSPVTIIVNSQSPNLALNKYVLSSSNLNNSTLASNAVDGNMITTWSSAYTNPQWIYVDLGTNYSINQVKISWASDYATNYKIQASTDLNTWTDILTVTGNVSQTNNWTGLSATGRYVRIYCTTGATSNGYSMYELEVYGGPAPTRFASIENPSAEETTLYAYPNPASEELNIAFNSSSQQMLHITLTDMSMKEGVAIEFNATEGFNKMNVAVDQLPVGLYILKVIGTGVNYTSKIMIQR